MPDLYAVLMAGGSGTRFWPASRADRPKQFLPIAGDRPMLAQTARRLDGVVPPERLLVVTAGDQAGQVRRCLPQLPEENLLIEPEARNTAAAVAFAALEVRRRDPDSVHVVLPADHVIEPLEAFRGTLAAAAEEAAESRALLTLGVRPTHAATGYGYIDAGERIGERGGVPVHRVDRFVEKPDRERAEAFLAEGGFWWNAGIFVWRTDAILDAYRAHRPALLDALEPVGITDPRLPEVYATLEKEPVDVAILERAADVRMVPIDYTWSDVGSWAALFDLTPAREDGNHTVLQKGARLVAEDASGNLVYAEREEVIALVGVSDLVVVRAGGATLVCPRERAQEVKRIVERLQADEDGRRYL